MPQEFKYWAFISYSQRDVKWATWLHRKLEAYRVPRSLRKDSAAPLPNRLFPIFRDNDELPGAPDLGEAIQTALDASRHLVVVCSPRAAASPWVNKEILSFQALGRSNRILCFVIDGEPNAKADSATLECFPPALRSGNGSTRSPANFEPLAADARKGRDSARKALARLVAGLLGVDFDTLWRRERRRRLRRILRGTTAAMAIAGAAALVYLAVADIGVDVPGGPAVRLILDRYDASMLRPVHGAAEVNATAQRVEIALLQRLRGEWLSGAWVHNNSTRTKGPKLAISPWVSSQAACAALRALGSKVNEQPEFWDVLAVPFAKDVRIEADGKKFGWLVSDADYPQAEPALWTIAALAVALSIADESSKRRPQLLEWLEYTQTVADMYRPTGDGGWNVLPQQDDPSLHTTYATTLALLAMLELRRAGLGWHGDRARLDAQLRGAVRWLAGEFDPASTPPGWHLHLNEAGNANTGEVADGLTLQIYSELLRAEEEAAIEIPDEILTAIPRHLDSLIGRPPNYQPGLGVLSRAFTNFDGVKLVRSVSESYLWHPWGIEASVRWLRRLERTNGAPEAKTQARRILGYLTVGVGAPLFKAATTKAATFVQSETLYALATLLSERR
jgi:hypothetical protein